MAVSGSSARCRARSVERHGDVTPGAIASLKWEDWLAASVMKAPGKGSGPNGKQHREERSLTSRTITWLILVDCSTLLLMQKSTIKPGRPSGTPTYESEAASAFGQAVRAARVAQGVAQDVFASRAGVSRSHMGKIERGEHVPTLPLILKISTALRLSAAELMAATERNLGAETDT